MWSSPAAGLCCKAVLYAPMLLAAQVGAQGLPGRIVVASDEWFLSNTGFSAQPTNTNRFVANLTAWFKEGTGGSFLAYSSNFSLTGLSLRNAIIQRGHTWTVSTAVPFDLPTLSTYDGLFLAGTAVPDLDVLVDYVQTGGNVLLLAGTSSNAAATASRWNPLLDDFGLELESVTDGVCIGGCSLGLSSSHPVLAGVTALYHDGGQDVRDIDATDLRSQVIALTNGHERFAVFDGGLDNSPPTLACPPSVSVIDRKGTPPGENVFFLATANDDVYPAPSVICVPPSGSFFPRGTTIVTCTATDASGNQSTCTFPVVVVPTVRER